MPGIYSYYGKLDLVAVRTAWNDWTDTLYKSGDINKLQYENWVNPFG